MQRIPFDKHASDSYIKERGESPCFICEIVEGKPRRAMHHIIFENDDVIVFFSAFPTQLGQTLVCPKKHVEQVAMDLSEAAYLNLQKTVYTVSQAVQKALNPERLYIASFGSQQMNKHVHFHIVPLPAGTPIRDQQMAAMLPELVGLVTLSELEWTQLVEKIQHNLPPV